MSQIYYYDNTIFILSYFHKDNHITKYVGLNLINNQIVQIDKKEFKKIF